MCDAPIDSRARDHVRVYTNYHTNIRYGLNGSIPLSWYTADPIYITFKPVLSILSNAHLFVAASIAHLLAASISHFVRCCIDSISKGFTTLYIDAYSMQKWAVAGQRPDTKLGGIQRLILFIKVAREHGGIVLDSNILNPAIRLKSFKGVKGR